jgi:hypothetical protein
VSANDDFERLAAMYYSDTGHLAPGKDDPLNARTVEERFAEFDKWQAWRLSRPLFPRAGYTETWAQYHARTA